MGRPPTLRYVPLLLMLMAAASGLLAMHVPVTASHPPSEEDGRMVHAAMPMADGIRVDASSRLVGTMSADLHGLLDCVWVVVGVITIVALAVSRRRHTIAAPRLRFFARTTATAIGRAPPASTRLSLVGVARC